MNFEAESGDRAGRNNNNAGIAYDESYLKLLNAESKKSPLGPKALHLCDLPRSIAREMATVYPTTKEEPRTIKWRRYGKSR